MRPIKPTSNPGHDVGFVLTDVEFKPVRANGTAVEILRYEQESTDGDPAALQRRIQSILQVERFESDLPPREFLSGRRRYVCRSFLLDAAAARERHAALALLFERDPRRPIRAVEDITRHFNFSRREAETVHLLTLGLTTKEIAERMDVSPHTVKQYIRLVMGKMNVTTRSGIVGRVLCA